LPDGQGQAGHQRVACVSGSQGWRADVDTDSSSIIPSFEETDADEVLEAVTALLCAALSVS